MKRRRQRDTGGGDMPDLPITPMLDMSFQLLLFLIPFFQPAPIEGQMDLNLPAMGEAKANTPEDVDPSKSSDTQLELPSDISVIAKTASEGASVGIIEKIAIQRREGKEIEIPNDSSQWEEVLLDRLKKVRAQKDLGSQDDIKIQADRRLKYEFVARIMDVCRRAGFKRIGFAPPGDLGGKT